MRRKLLTITLYALFVSAVLCLSACNFLSENQSSPKYQSNVLKIGSPPKLFPSFSDKYAPPDWWRRENRNDPKKFPIFELKQDYPRIPVSESQEWQKKEFAMIFDVSKPYAERKKIAKRYIVEVLKYAYKGNIENDWNVKTNKVRDWFHAPWLHVNYREKTGAERNSGSREFLHGLTAERCSCRAELDSPDPGEMCPSSPANFQDSEEKLCPDTSPVQNWGVAFYNAKGAMTIAKVWEEMTVHERDSSKYPDLEKIGKMDFPDGTVVIKLLFTNASDTEAPNLAGSRLIWNADTNRYKYRNSKDNSFFNEQNCLKNDENFKKCFPGLRLLQMDVAVRDHRADRTTGWVFGTFIYNKNAKSVFDERTDAKSDWEKVEPVGLMFGNDPGVNFDQPSEKLRENFIFTDLKQHLGCGGRLNGPVDNPRQSCLACHAGSEILPVYKKIETTKDPCNERFFNSYFRNVKSGEPITPEGVSLNYSLQLQAGIVRYCIANPGNCAGKGGSEKFGFSHEVERDE
ncbi:MAG: hypothetical protein LUM44_22000 [Pyrinomonadaceae bacterium]|nr:hypothetical protein [Pyrinomonadaceae bacterium]